MPPAGQSFHLSSEKSHHQLDGLLQKKPADIHRSLMMCPNDFGYHLSLIFHTLNKMFQRLWDVLL